MISPPTTGTLVIATGDNQMDPPSDGSAQSETVTEITEEIDVRNMTGVAPTEEEFSHSEEAKKCLGNCCAKHYKEKTSMSAFSSFVLPRLCNIPLVSFDQDMANLKKLFFSH